jgi:hypothetical protein
MCDFRAWLLLASASGLFKGDDAEDTDRFLDRQIRQERRARWPQGQRVTKAGVAGNDYLGMSVQGQGKTD